MSMSDLYTGRKDLIGSRASLCILMLLLFSLTACNLFREQIAASTPAPESILHVTADQIAHSMQEEYFFSDYGPYTLLVQGTISSVNPQGAGQRVELSTSVDTTVLCDLGNRSAVLHVGEPITVAAPAAEVQRADSAVLLANCRFP